jgi:Family of unknown function (DUF5309)
MPGTTLYPDFNAYPGVFTELNPVELPITSLLMAKGIDLLPNKEYTYTYHTNPDMVTPSLTLASDLGTVNYGSTGFTTGSNVMNVWFEGAAVSWARMNDQALGRTLGFNGPSNPSIEANPMSRALAEALLRMKTQFEYVAREGLYRSNSAGDGTWQQRGYRKAPGILNTAVGVAGGSAVGSYAILTRAIMEDALQTLWDRKVNGSDRLTIVCNSIAKRQIGSIWGSAFQVGNNNMERNYVGRNIQTILTDFGEIDILLTHTLPQSQMYILNLSQMRAVGHVSKNGQLIYESPTLPPGIAGDGRALYTEMGVDHGVGSCHARFYGIGSTAGHLTTGTVEAT